MARGDKLGKSVRKVNDKKRAAVHKMVEAIIRGDSDSAAEELRSYLQLATRDLILGEAKDSEEADVCEECGKETCECDKDDKDSDDDDSDKDSDDDDSDSDDKDSDDDSDKDSDDDSDDDELDVEEEEKSKKKKKK